MNYIIVDFEMNPIAREYIDEIKVSQHEIMEIGAVVMDENFLVIDEFMTFVKPQYNQRVHKRYETLTGISTQMVSEAPPFSIAYEMFVDWCESHGKEYEIYAWSDNDLKQLIAEMKLKKYNNLRKMEPICKWYDFQKEFKDKLCLENVISLEKALYYIGIKFDGRMHDALCDAKNTAELFAITRDEKRNTKELKIVMEALRPKNINDTLGDLFDFGALITQVV